MRLSAAERRAVECASRETLPAGTRVLLFGSRVDDSRRGGDIDLLVELPGPLSADDIVERRTRFTARLYRLLEERRIDVVVTQQGCPDPRAVVTAARQQGMELSELVCNPLGVSQDSGPARREAGGCSAEATCSSVRQSAASAAIGAEGASIHRPTSLR